MSFRKIKKRSYGYVRRVRRLRGKIGKNNPEWPELKRKIRKWIIGFIAAGFLFLTIFVAWASKNLPDPDHLTDRQVAQSTKIYDRTGEHLLYEIFAEQKRTLVELEDIPEVLVKGVVATEDTKFYEHKGVRPLSILRGVLMGIFTSRRVGGTSTLTQQLVKNAILTNERTITRKIKEAILSIRLEQKYTKDQILKIYFNEIPYGSTNYGVEAAAQSYFGKSVSDLTLAESATLAGMPKAPTTYLNNRDKLTTRRNFVLKRMYEEGFITEAEKREAQNSPLNLDRHYGDIKAPHFVLHVREQLVETYGESLVDTGGLKVITTLDWEKQQIAEEAVEDIGTDKLAAAGANNTALVALDPKTSQIVSMVGSKDFFDEDINGQFNVATLGRRQPGSSIKPIMYAAAFEKGFTPETILFDVLTNFAIGGNAYMPRNYDLSEHGPVTMRKALQGSLNISAVKTLYLAGIEKAIEFATRLGYSGFNKDTVGLSLVLGGGEVNMIDHAQAFGVFANSGVKHDEVVSILRVEDNDGEILEEWKKKRGKQVIDAKVAHTITNVMSDDAARAYAFGTGGVLTLPGRPVAAKTGTTNGYVDAWTVGFTPSLVTVVWAGNTNNTPMKPGFGGSRVAGPIWKHYMTNALKNTVVEGFPAPPPTKAKKAVLLGSQGGGVTLKVNKVTGKRATTSTPEKYIVERTYLLPHSILHYVDKEDPHGPVPSNPATDPQYERWEASIQDWIARKKEKEPDWEISFEEPPEDFDDSYSLENIPTLTVVEPKSGSTLTTREINTDIRVSAPRGVHKVSYKLDGKYVGVVKEHPFNLNHNAKGLEPGEHTLTIIVSDDVGNQIEEAVTFTLSAEETKPSVSWINPPSTITVSDFPRAFAFSHNKIDEISAVALHATKGDEEMTLGIVDEFENLYNNQIFITWQTAPDPGEWTLTPFVELKGDEHAIPQTSRTITIN